MTEDSEFFFMEAFFLLYFHQNNVLSDFADAVPWNDVFTVTSEERTEASRSGNNQSGQLVRFAVEFNINGAAETAAGTGVDDFLLF